MVHKKQSKKHVTHNEPKEKEIPLEVKPKETDRPVFCQHCLMEVVAARVCPECEEKI